MPPPRHRERYDDDGDRTRRSPRRAADGPGGRRGGPAWLAPVLVGGGAVAVAAVVVVVLLSRGAPPRPAPAPPGAAPAVPPAPEPDAPFRARLIGVWERPPAADGLPVRLEFRPDGTAEVRHHPPGAAVQVAAGELVAPDRAGPGPVAIQMTVMNGAYGFRCRFDGDDLVLAAGGGEVRLRRVR